MEDFEIVSEITDIEVIAVGPSVRDRAELNRRYGRARWRKLKGKATVELVLSGRRRPAELHWYEAHGIGVREYKIKMFLD